MRERVGTGLWIALGVIGMVLGLWALYTLRTLVILVLMAVILCVGIDPLVERLHRITLGRWRLPRGLAAVLILLCGLLVLLGILSFFVYTAAREAISFADYLRGLFNPVTADDLRHVEALKHNRIVQWLQAYIAAHPEQVAWVQSQSGKLGGYLWSTTRTLFAALGTLFSLVLVLILTLFFTSFKEGILYTLLQFFPPHTHGRMREIGAQVADKMGGWLRGQIILALIIMAVTTLAMWAFGVPYAIMIGIVGGLGEMIPMLGPAIAGIPAVAIALFTGMPFWLVVVVGLFFFALAQAENYILAPKVMERHVELNPVTTILALLAGATLGGIIGAVLAVPIAAGLRVVLLEAVFPAIQGRSRAEIEAGRPDAPPTPPAPTNAPPSDIPVDDPAPIQETTPSATEPPKKRRKARGARV